MVLLGHKIILSSLEWSYASLLAIICDVRVTWQGAPP